MWIEREAMATTSLFVIVDKLNILWGRVWEEVWEDVRASWRCSEQSQEPEITVERSVL